MSLPISRKAEKAVTGYLQSSLGISGLHIYEGHDKVDEIQFPSLVIYAEGSSPHPEMPTEVGVRNVRLRCKFSIHSGINSRTDADDWRQKLEAKLTDDLPALQAALNKPIGTDNRTVKGIHFHYVEMSDDPSDRNENDWIEDLNFSIVCELLDS